MPTVHDVAKLAGVSLATVSRTLNEPDIVKEETRKRVLAAVEALNFVPASSARALRKARACSIGLVLPQLSNPFFPSLIEAASIEAEKRGYSVLVRVDDDPLRACHYLARSGAVEGIALVDQRLPRLVVPHKVDLGIPVVAFDRTPSFTVESTYQVDNVHGASIVTQHLLEVGATRLLHISGLQDLDVTVKRTQGFYDGIAQSSQTAQETRVVSGDFTFDSGFAAVEQVLADGFAVDGIFAANDLMAVGAIRALIKSGRRVPEDVVVAGFDGLSLTKFVSPTLTTLEQPVEQIVNATVTHLLDLVDSPRQEIRLSSHDIVRIPGTLIKRQSTNR
ncbi:MAG: LacI family DNA-binding transcriptional regulator [Actinomycetaceae bacterium]|nr:LacI family DNA-binding transcriptional regulator [Actinomycetaceae bacterium]